MNVQLWVTAILVFFLSSPHAPRVPAARTGPQEQASPSKSARETFGLRGPVKTYTEENILPDRRTMSTYQEYDREGEPLEMRARNPDGSEWVRTWTYDANGRLLRTTSGKPSEPGVQTLYAYDDAGRMISITSSSNSDRTDFHYDEQGHKTEIKTFDPKTLEHARNIGLTGSGWFAAMAGSGVPAGGSVTAVYDENDRPVEEQVHDADDHLISRIIRTYNAAGLMIEEKPILENPAAALDKLPPEVRSQLNDAQAQTMATLLNSQAQSATFFSYDAQGRVTSKRQTGVFQSVTTTSYNDQGDIAEERTTMVSTLTLGASFSIAENGILAPSKFTGPASNVLENSDVHYTYQYDDQSNWTEQSLTDASHPDSPATVRRRRITYY